MMNIECLRSVVGVTALAECGIMRCMEGSEYIESRLESLASVALICAHRKNT